MRKFETLVGSTVWLAIAFVTVFAALEPVAITAHRADLAMVAGAACADTAACLSLLCETSTL